MTHPNQSNQKKFQPLNLTLIGMFLSSLFLWYVHYAIGPYLAEWLQLMLVVVAIAVSLGLMIGVIALAWISYEKARQATERRFEINAVRRQQEATATKIEAEAKKMLAEAMKLQREAAIFATVTRPGELLHITHTAGAESKTVIPALAGSSHVNGHTVKPNDEELQRWYYLHGSSGSQAQLPEPAVHPLIAGPRLEEMLPQRVELLDLLPNRQGSLRSIVLGQTVDKASGKLRTVTAPIWQLVHIANAGATDSGKSNMARSIAYQVGTARNTQMVLVDLKRQTFKPFTYSEKLVYPIITSIEEFAAVIGEIMGEVDRRLALFETDITIETIHDYNMKTGEPLPYIVIFIDEISNIFRDKATQELFFNVISMSRAAGIYFVCAGQTWSHRTMQTSIRQQFRTGFHFATNDAASSRMILNDSRATEIELQGRAYATLPFGLEKEVIELQTPYLDLNTLVQTLPQATNTTPQPIPVLEPTEQEAQILELHQQGWKHSQICKEVWGYKSSNKYPEIDRVIERFAA